MDFKLKYQTRFEKARQKFPKIVKGDLLLLEKIKFPEKPRASGIYIPDSDIDPKEMAMLGGSRTDFYLVLQAGEGYTNSAGVIDLTDPGCKLDIEPDNIVAIPSHSIQWFKSIPPLDEYSQFTIGVAKASEVRLTFKSLAEFQEYFSILNEGLNVKIAS